MNVYQADRIFIEEGSVKRILDLNNVVLWEKKNLKSIPFYVENISDSSEILTIEGTNHEADPSYAGFDVEYSLDMMTWNLLGNTDDGNMTLNISEGQRVYLRAKTNRWWNGIRAGGQLLMDPCCILGISKVGGNIMSLIYGEDFTGEETSFPGIPTPFPANFLHLFNGNMDLISARDLIIPVSSELCCDGMFEGCTFLVTGPELTGKILGEMCYHEMFRGCSSLNEVKCYATSIPSSNCIDNWLYGVATIGIFYKDANMIYPTGVSGIPSGWTVRNL